LGVVLAIVGFAGIVFCGRATLERPRPADVAFATLTMLAVFVAMLGLALVFVPGFLS